MPEYRHTYHLCDWYPIYLILKMIHSDLAVHNGLPVSGLNHQGDAIPTELI